MPYKIVDKCVHKLNDDGSVGATVPGGCHDTEDEAKAHMRALYANVKASGVVEMSLRITKASYNKSDHTPMKWAAIDSDTDADLFEERMSPELYADFCSRIDNKTPVPEPFLSSICESDWCGGMPYLSIAHYKAGDGLVNVPGMVDSVYIDGNRLKSKGTLYDTPMGRKVFDSLREDLYMEKSGNQDHDPVRISIGFLDLEHEHVAKSGGQNFVFTRTDTGQICPMCAQGIGGKVYKKGQLVHLAMTRVPVNPRTKMMAEKSMSEEITTKRDDAKSIIGDLAEGLEEKSIPENILVVRSEGEPVSDPSPLDKCYDPNTGGWDNKCIASVMEKFMADVRNTIGRLLKSVVDEVVEESKRKDVTPADKKQAEKEYGDVKYADETNKKYPIDTKEHAKAALSYWGMPKNREKYSAEDQKKIGGRIRAAAKKFGIDVTDKKSDTVEDKMDEKAMGIEEKPFNFGGVNGNGSNETSGPVIKAEAEDAEEADDAKDTKKDEEKEGEMKSLDSAYASLKSVLANAKSVEDVQNAFNALGREVEKSYTPPAPAMGDIAEIVRSAVEAAVTPLKMEIAQLKAQKQTEIPAGGVVRSKALNFNGVTNNNNPAALLQKAVPAAEQAPVKQLSQIERLARKSAGLQG